MKNQAPRPPRWATKFLSWYCRPTLLEDLEGDLNEYFQRNLKSKGLRRAKIVYVLDVLKFFRPYTIRKPEFLHVLIHSIMIRSYITTSGRNLMRNKFFSSINILGLAISMSVGLLIIAMLNDLFSYDSFHDKHDRIYRVISQYQFKDRKDDDFHATTSMKAATAIRETISGPEEVAILHHGFSGDVSFEEKIIPLNGLFADQKFFNVFSFELLEGDPVTALGAPFSVVLTEESAKKIFNDTHVLGKTILLNKDRAYTITGVMKDVPKFSHMQFDMLGSLSTREITEIDRIEDEMAWDNMWRTYAYLVMPEKADLKALQVNLDRLSEREDKTVKDTHIKLSLQPIDDIMTGDNLSNQLGPTMGKTAIRVFSIMAFIVILSACFNYTNLSIARSFKRSREIGIRKTIGALRAHVITQFIVESVIIALLALIFSFLMFLLLRSHFISLEYSLQALLTLYLSPRLIALFILFAIVVGVFAGIFPAIFFSRLNAIQVLKNLTSKNIIKGVTMRKVLIVFQYTISIIFITGTLIINTQYKHFLAYDLGFTTENILNIRLQGNKAGLLIKELRELPEVHDISQSMAVMSIGNYYKVNVKNPLTPEDTLGEAVNFNSIDEKYISLHGLKLIAGENFKSKPDSAEETEIIVNQQFLKRFNIAAQDPTKAIGETVKLDSKDVRIAGVVNDFEYGRANNRNPNKEVVLRYQNDSPGYLNVKLESHDWLTTRAKIENIWKKIDPVHTLDAKFYDDQIEEAFQGLAASVRVGGFIAFLVICIASIGLLGMVVYTTETKLKEISIRKVLGASESGILYLLGKGFLILLSIACTIALPVTYLVFDRIMLPNITNHAPLSLTEFLMGTLSVMSIALLMIGSQTLKAVRTNPAEVLKVE